jgi:hypothetical protein
MRGTSTGLEAAVSDLQAALKLEPGNTQVGDHLDFLSLR